MASYTANLATLLIQQPASSFAVKSIDDANSRQLHICALADSTQVRGGDLSIQVEKVLVVSELI